MIDAFTLERINAMENAAHVWGEPCTGQFCDADGRYDCENFAGAKYRALIALGAKPSDVVLRYVTDEAGEGHMVLVYKHKVLDNRYPRVMPVKTLVRIGYKGLEPN